MRTRNSCLLKLAITSLFVLSALDLSFRLNQNGQSGSEGPRLTSGTAENGPAAINVSSSWLENERSFCPFVKKKTKGPTRREGEEPLDQGALINLYLSRIKKILPNSGFKKNIPAIVVPYRDRRSHLETLLQNLVLADSRENQPYAVYVVEQLGKTVFNRGTLFNIGFVMALAHGNHSCYVFHDVDMVPAKSNPPYYCGSHPRHLAYAVDSFWGKMPYDDYAGGVIAMTSEQYLAINGHSNRYWGWGGEDDDLSLRIARANMWLDRGNMTEAKYHMLPHKKDKSNPRNRFRRILVKLGSRAGGDGLTTLCFEIVNVRQNSSLSYIHIGVSLDTAENRTANEITRIMKRLQ